MPEKKHRRRSLVALGVHKDEPKMWMQGVASHCCGGASNKTKSCGYIGHQAKLSIQTLRHAMMLARGAVRCLKWARPL